jgi:hypothetical protein
VDSSLAVLIGGTAVFAGTVAHLLVRRDHDPRRAAVAAAVTAAAVTASFLLTLFLATVALPAALAFVALAGGAVAYLAFRPDLGERRAALAATGAAGVVTASFLLVVYLGVIAYIVAIGTYLLLRPRLRVGPAMILMGTTLSGLLAASGLAFWVSLTYVM